MKEYISHYDSPLGGITLASDGTRITGLWFDGQKYFGYTLDPEHEDKDLDIFHTANEWLGIYFSGNEPGFTPPLSVKVSPFRKRVCEIMSGIPYGKTMSYKEIAAVIAAERNLANMSAQAVGSSVGHNPISIIIPCHRVIGKNGNLTGYSGGIEKKIKLLKLEGVDLKPLSMPEQPYIYNYFQSLLKD